MSAAHEVVEGDHLSRLAEQHGFENFETLWDHPDNADLKAARDNPNVLARGDVVMIPDKDDGGVSAATGATHRFVLKTQGLALQFRLLDFLGRPFAAQPCSVTVDGDAQDLTLDADGQASVQIARSADAGSVSGARFSAEFLIGFLEPVETESGWRNRLLNLGYLDDPDDDDTAALALEDFQIDQGLEATSAIDDTTRARLRDVHGC